MYKCVIEAPTVIAVIFSQYQCPHIWFCPHCPALVQWYYEGQQDSQVVIETGPILVATAEEVMLPLKLQDPKPSTCALTLSLRVKLLAKCILKNCIYRNITDWAHMLFSAALCLMFTVASLPTWEVSSTVSCYWWLSGSTGAGDVKMSKCEMNRQCLRVAPSTPLIMSVFLIGARLCCKVHLIRFFLYCLPFLCPGKILCACAVNLLFHLWDVLAFWCGMSPCYKLCLMKCFNLL